MRWGIPLDWKCTRWSSLRSHLRQEDCTALSFAAKLGYKLENSSKYSASEAAVVLSSWFEA